MATFGPLTTSKATHAGILTAPACSQIQASALVTLPGQTVAAKPLTPRNKLRSHIVNSQPGGMLRVTTRGCGIRALDLHSEFLQLGALSAALPVRKRSVGKKGGLSCSRCAAQASSVALDSWQGLADATYRGGGKSEWLAGEAERLQTMQKRTGDGLLLTRGSWDWEVREPRHYRLTGKMTFLNITRMREMFVPEISPKLVLLSGSSIDGFKTTLKVRPNHPGGYPKARADGYWNAYITRAGESTEIEVEIDIVAEGPEDLTNLKAARLELSYFSYGPHGRTPQTQHVVFPLEFPGAGGAGGGGGGGGAAAGPQWRQAGARAQVLPIPTHLLCHQDDPAEVVRTYVSAHAQPGDVLAIGESPLAIMQGRFRHPASVRPSWLARAACLLFHPTSSLATACGMQSLIDIVGKARVFLAVLLGALFRLVGVRGMFYRVAGEESKLVDDVTGTLAPYDQFITLGPIAAARTCEEITRKTGCLCAVVDVNDLKKVDIIGASDGVDHAALTAALRDNPAGNSDEQTPLVLVRFKKQKEP